VIHDADDRLGVFVERMNNVGVDFILQLGDFCRPYERNRPFLDIWNRFAGPRHHVLGNHDMDGGFTHEQTMAYWQMPVKYHSFDAQGYHFVVLDGNDKKQDPAPGYARYIGTKQRDWLETDLAETELPTFLFSHQSLEHPGGVENHVVVRAILEAANKQAGWQKVVAAFSGHHHIDYYKTISDIHYVQINSMSYYWVGEKYKHERYDQATEQANPWLKYPIPYRDPLYAIATVRPDGRLEIEGTRSQFVPPALKEPGHPAEQNGHRITAEISDKRIRF